MLGQSKGPGVLEQVRMGASHRARAAVRTGRQDLHPLPGALPKRPGVARLFRVLAKSLAETIVVSPLTDLEQIPAVCFLGDVSRLLRIPVGKLRWLVANRLCRVPPLPSIDKRIRFSGNLLRWFLEQDDYAYRRFTDALEGERKRRRQWKRAWYEFGPPYSIPLVGAAIRGEEATLSAVDVASALRMSPAALRRSCLAPGFPLPPASRLPLRWSEGQLTRFLAAPEIPRLLRQLASRASAEERAKRSGEPPATAES